MIHFKTRSPATIGAVVALALIGALAAFSYHTAGQLDATFKAAGINPQSLAAWHPPAHRG
jgi:hypothetical protein